MVFTVMSAGVRITAAVVTVAVPLAALAVIFCAIVVVFCIVAATATVVVYDGLHGFIDRPLGFIPFLDTTHEGRWRNCCPFQSKRRINTPPREVASKVRLICPTRLLIGGSKVEMGDIRRKFVSSS